MTFSLIVSQDFLPSKGYTILRFVLTIPLLFVIILPPLRLYLNKSLPAFNHYEVEFIMHMTSFKIYLF